jgi:molecular chaperone GrpE
LRQELKLQTKSARGLEVAVQAALAGLDKAAAQFQSVPAREGQAADQASKPLVLSLIELDEALERGAQAIALLDRRIAERAPQELLDALDRRFADMSAWRRWLSADWHRVARQVCQQQAAETNARMFAALMDGYRLICVRLQRTLAEHQIRRLQCVGRPVDPQQMTVVELSDDPQVASETVVAELRPGYTWRGTVVRYAEVRAVRRVLSPPALGEEPGEDWESTTTTFDP